MTDLGDARRTTTPENIHAHMRVEDGLYVLGCQERRVTLYTQQVRALNLIYSLHALRVVPDGGEILVVGGGVAGLTAAAGAARLGLRVTLLERERELLHIQRNTTKRWIHPHIYDWPARGSTAPDAILPLLGWKAAPASDVVQQILSAFAALPERDRINVQLGAEITELGRGAERHVLWQAQSNHDARVSAVILAVGFGLEREIDGVELLSYWQDDALDHALSTTQRRILVSGTGDGGLIDVLRARLRDFRHDTMIDDLVGDAALDPVKQRLLAIEEEALTEERRVKGNGREHLFAAYKKLSDEHRTVLAKTVDAKLRARLREGVTVVLNGEELKPFSLGASILNRFLISRLFFAFDLSYRSGALAKPARSATGYEVRFKLGTPQTFDRVVWRHGPDGALERGFRDVWERCGSRLRDLAELDQTRWPIYGDVFNRARQCGPGGAGPDLATGGAVSISAHPGGDGAARTFAIGGAPSGTHGDRSDHTIFMAPPLPPQWIARSAHVDQIMAGLTSDDSSVPGVLVVSALHGLGGIGKTTLAKSVCHDPRTRSHFDCILWADFGRRADTLGWLTRWLLALGDSGDRPTSVGEASERLRAYLLGRTTLIVLDDVWDARDALPFLVSPTARVLITTRKATVADDLGAPILALSVMTTSEALTLLERWVRRTISGDERPDAETLADAVGHLPLALALAGALVARGTPWASARSAFVQETQRISIQNPHLTRQLAKVYACLNVSLQAVREEDPALWDRFARLGVLGEPCVLNSSLCARLWQIPEHKARQTLSSLADDALLQHSAGRYQLHTFVHELARQTLYGSQPDGLGVAPTAAHLKTLESFGWSTEASAASALLDDEYVYSNLVWHLEQANQGDQIHRLLSQHGQHGSNAWYVALAKRGLDATFVRDVGHASELARRDTRPFPLLCRYALIRNSLEAQHMSESVLAALVKRGIWSPARGLSVARNMTDPSTRAACLVELARVLDGSSTHLDHLHSAIDDARATLSTLIHVVQFQNLAKLLQVSFLKDEARAAVVASLLSTIGRATTHAASQAAPELPKDVQAAALSRILASIDRPNEHADSLKYLAARTKFLLPAMRREWTTQMLHWSTTSAFAPEHASDGIFGMLKSLADAIDDTTYDIAAPIMDSAGLRRQLDAAVQLSREDRTFDAELNSLGKLQPFKRLERLAWLRDILPARLIASARKIAASAILAEAGAAAQAFDSLSWLLPTEQRATLAREILPMIMQSSDADGGWALARTIAELPPAERVPAASSAFARLAQEPRGSWKDSTVALFVGSLPAEFVVGRLLPDYRRIGDLREQAALRFELAPYLEPERLSDLGSENIADLRVKMFARVMQHLVGVLTAAQLQNLVRAACAMVGEWWAVEELSFVLLITDNPRAIERVLDAAREMQHADLRSRLAARVISRIAEVGNVDEALAAAWRIELSAERARGLSDTAVMLAKLGRLDVARRVAATITDRDERGRAQAWISLLAGQLGQMADARSDAANISSDRWRSWALDRLSTSSPSEMTSTPILHSLKALKTDNGAMLDPLRVRAIGNQRWAELLDVVSSASQTNLDATLCAFWRRTNDRGRTFIDDLAETSRSRTLEELRSLVHIVALSGAFEDLGRLEDAVRDVSRWWP